MTIKFTLLGTGSSMGVPRADGFFGNCDPNNKKNYRTRCSALISSKYSNTLIDTSPDLRAQLLSQKITSIDRVLYSHMHADQTHGINDLRIFYLKKKEKISVYANKSTRSYLKKSFSYCFKKKYDYPAILKLNVLKKILIFYEKKNKIKIKSIPVEHGSINCMAFIINDKLAYASDVNNIHKKNIKYFKNLKYLVIDCLRFQKHPAHFNLSEVLEQIKILKPRKTILTNLHSDLDYKYLLKTLPKNVLPGYDGMSLKI
jgi:phosphoribosyl 1,2-cyclic phosphate phosphodiesterase